MISEKYFEQLAEDAENAGLKNLLAYKILLKLVLKQLADDNAISNILDSAVAEFQKEGTLLSEFGHVAAGNKLSQIIEQIGNLKYKDD